MSVTVYGRHDDDAVFEDDNGPARIPRAAQRPAPPQT